MFGGHCNHNRRYIIGLPTQLIELQSLTYSYWFSGTVVREDMGYTLEEAGKEVLGSASKVVIKKDSTSVK